MLQSRHVLVAFSVLLTVQSCKFADFKAEIENFS